MSGVGLLAKAWINNLVQQALVVYSARPPWIG